MLRAQEWCVFDTSFLSAQYNNFFTAHPHVEAVVFSCSGKLPKKLRVVERNIAHNVNDFYNFDFEGDRYVFEKRYSPILIPITYVDLVSSKFKEYQCNTTIRIVPDTIFATVKYLCKPDSEVEYAFVRVSLGAYYLGELSLLERKIEHQLKNEKLIDSVYFFRVVVGRDSVVRKVEMVEGRGQLMADVVERVLISSGKWRPAIQGGRDVNSYFRVFVRVFSNGKVRMYFQEL